MNRLSIKNQAKQQISGNIGVLFLISLILSVFGLISYIPIVGSIVYLIVVCVCDLSMAMIYLNLGKGIKPRVSNLSDGFSNWQPAFILGILQMIFITLWSFLFIIPGIVKSYSYSMAYYILAENPELSASEALNQSKELMNGHKADLFMLDLSFIGWFFIGAITFGLAFIYVAPYMEASRAIFYKEISSVTY